MPLQNRVDPWGRLVAATGRGTLTGNRGILHDEQRRIVRSHTSKAWITCVLEWKGVRRRVMTGRKWTELFFLDEATALAAGHRPCAYCRRNAYNRFVEAWSTANPELAPVSGRKAPVIDAALHRQRRHENGSKRTYRAEVTPLPAGVVYVDDDGVPHVTLADVSAARWTLRGYDRRHGRPAGLHTILTPPATVGALATGYAAMLHPSAPLGD